MHYTDTHQSPPSVQDANQRFFREQVLRLFDLTGVPQQHEVASVASLFPKFRNTERPHLAYDDELYLNQAMEAARRLHQSDLLDTALHTKGPYTFLHQAREKSQIERLFSPYPVLSDGLYSGDTQKFISGLSCFQSPLALSIFNSPFDQGVSFSAAISNRALYPTQNYEWTACGLKALQLQQIDIFTALAEAIRPAFRHEYLSEVLFCYQSLPLVFLDPISTLYINFPRQTLSLDEPASFALAVALHQLDFDIHKPAACLFSKSLSEFAIEGISRLEKARHRPPSLLLSNNDFAKTAMPLGSERVSDWRAAMWLREFLTLKPTFDEYKMLSDLVQPLQDPDTPSLPPSGTVRI